MPIDLWLECVCDSTVLGEEVAVVGNVPILGSWCPEHAIALETSPESFPRWTLRQPLRIEEEPAKLSACLEYKYIIRRPGDSNCRWEDLGLRELPSFASTASTSANLRIEQLLKGGFSPRPLNRRLPCCQALRVRGSHGVSMRVDFLGSYAPLLEAAWIVPAAWDPQLAGHEGTIGPECFRVARDPATELPLPGGSAQEALRRALLEALCEDDRPRPFIALRSRLLGGLSQLCRKHYLPIGIWRQVGDYLGGVESSWPAGTVKELGI
jgi:hypothetical protein